MCKHSKYISFDVVKTDHKNPFYLLNPTSDIHELLKIDYPKRLIFLSFPAMYKISEAL